jgi:hypothetical protein
MRKKSFVVIARSPALRGTTKQSDNLLKFLKARLLCYARNGLSVGFPQTIRKVSVQKVCVSYNPPYSNAFKLSGNSFILKLVLIYACLGGTVHPQVYRFAE